jgi:hypothetical protein
VRTSFPTERAHKQHKQKNHRETEMSREFINAALNCDLRGSLFLSSLH